MKPFNFSLIISSVILGLSFITGCLLIRGEIPNETNEIANQYKPLMNISETADYLNLSEYKIQSIISSEENILKQTGFFTGKMFPFIKINNEIYVSRNDLSDWLKESTSQRKEY